MTKGKSTVTVKGKIQQGVESGCLLLEGYLLLGGPRKGLLVGRTVSVTGRVAVGLSTTCQQGTPLQVDRVTPVD